jgi:hypothetical protein
MIQPRTPQPKVPAHFTRRFGFESKALVWQGECIEMTARQLFATALTALVSIGLSNTSKAADADFKPMFDGKSTTGWTKPFDWGEVAVADGEIILTGSKKFFLVTEKTYKNFILEGEVFCPKGGNSGFQFRCHFQKNKLWGYQAEVDTSDRKWAGGLYDEGRRGWLVSLKDKPEAQAAFKNDAWNKYRIEAVGDHLKIFVNGVQTVDYHDSMDAEGHLALQHHGEKGLTYKFRNVQLKTLPDSPANKAAQAQATDSKN